LRTDRPAVVFDLDGTLVDSAPDLHVLVNRLLAGMGRAALDLPSIVEMIGDGTAALVERAFQGGSTCLRPQNLDILVARFIEDYERDPVRLTRPYPGVPQTLGLLRSEGYRLGVCTNKLERLADAILSKLKLDRFFDAIVGSDSVGIRKPNPASILETIRRLGPAIRSGVVMVGDSDADLQAARNAGIPVVLVSYGYSRVPPSGLGADAHVDRFIDLPKAIMTLSRSACCPGEQRRPTARSAAAKVGPR
jgi:phosphoglycolate phosphatase